MSDEKIDQPVVKRPATPLWKRWHFKSRFILMLLGAFALIVYLLRSKQYEGLGAALCAIACGGFLVWHAIHLFAEEDAFDEQQLRANPPGQETNLTAPPPEPGQNPK